MGLALIGGLSWSVALRCRQADIEIIADGGERFQRHVPGALDGPLLGLLHEDGTDEPHDRGLVRKDADDVRASLDLAVQPLDRIGNRYEDPGANVRHRTRIKNEVHAILHAHLIPKCPHADLFNKRGRDWLTRQPVPDDERAAIARHVRELDRLGEDLAMLDRDIAQGALEDEPIRRLLTITGVNLTVAAGLMAAIGSIDRFASPQKLVSYFGLNPRVRQSGLGPAHHGRISKAGRSHARAMLVEAAWAAAKAPGPLRAFFIRIRARRGHQIAAVAVARKLAALCWHMLTRGEDYRWARPSLVAQKHRSMELAAGQPQKKGNKRGTTYAYHVKELRHQEMQVAKQAEKSYEHFVAAWRSHPSTKGGCATASNRQGLNRLPDDASSRHATLCHEVDRTGRE